MARGNATIPAAAGLRVAIMIVFLACLVSSAATAFVVYVRWSSEAVLERLKMSINEEAWTTKEEESLVLLMSAGRHQTRIAALHVAREAPTSTVLLEALARMLSDDDMFVRGEAAKSLSAQAARLYRAGGALPPSVEDAVLHATERDLGDSTSYFCIRALGYAGDPESARVRHVIESGRRFQTGGFESVSQRALQRLAERLSIVRGEHANGQE